MSLVEPEINVQALTENLSVNFSCAHCGLPVPKGLVELGAAEQFCCSGCKVAYQLIHSSGLDAFYRMAESSGNAPLTNRESGTLNRFDEFDQSAFMERFGSSINDSVNQITLRLDGIHCAACIWLIEKLPRIVRGVLEVQLNWARQTARIRWQKEQIQLSQIAETLHQLGYTPHPFRASESETRRQLENRRYLIRIGIAAAAAGNNMLIAASMYFGMFAYMSVGMSQMLRIASCAVGLAALFWPGRIFLQGAVNAIRTRTTHMDLPIALGLTVGSCAGLVNTIRGAGEIYFDSLSVLIFLLLVGRWIQFRQQTRAADAVEMLYQLTPHTARKIIDGRVIDTFVDLVQPNDLIEIRPGELVPVDAVVVEGTTEVDESILSGESRLQQKSIGDEVLAGTQNRSSAITVNATATGRETRLSKIVDLVEQASLDKPEVVQWANRIGGYFVVAVITLAFVTLVSWLWIDPTVAVDRSVALLIVACPCALALATPLAISVAIGRAAKRKIMIKGGDVLQLLNRPGTIWLDKTGTLTEGKMEVVKWYGETRWQPMVRALEAKSSHPVAKAIVQFGETQREGGLFEFDELREHQGYGMEAIASGTRFLVGNFKLLNRMGVAVSQQQQETANQILESNLAPCWIAVNDEISAILAIGDQIRPDTSEAIEGLIQAGWKVGILSGDQERIVQQVAKRLGIELAVGSMSPEDKVKVIKESMAREETVVMVGDGVNDSAALAAATVGIAVHNGAEASLAAAPVYLAEEGLAPILQLMKISNSTSTTIRRNFAASIGYNFLGATLAVFGWINPLVAAVLMPISSLTVVAISLSAGKSNSSTSKRHGVNS